jgi:hypothetical protein
MRSYDLGSQLDPAGFSPMIDPTGFSPHIDPTG